MRLNLKLQQNLIWLRYHISPWPVRTNVRCTSTIGEKNSSGGWVGGGGKRLKQVYFIGAGSAMDLVHSAAWER